MSEEKVQENVQENVGGTTENRSENADNGLLQEVMKYKSQRNELRDEISSYKAEKEKDRQKQLAEDGKKDELIAELNQKVDHLTGENTRLSKYETDEKTRLIASIASDESEAEQLEKESLSTLRLLDKKIATKKIETPTARGSVGNQPPPDVMKMSGDERRKNWGDIIKQYTNK